MLMFISTSTLNKNCFYLPNSSMGATEVLLAQIVLHDFLKIHRMNPKQKSHQQAETFQQSNKTEFEFNVWIWFSPLETYFIIAV